MVDMVEARKRAKKKAKKNQASPETEAEAEPSQAKPVLRSETTSNEPITAYFPIETQHKTEKDPIQQEAIPAESCQKIRWIFFRNF